MSLKYVWGVSALVFAVCAAARADGPAEAPAACATCNTGACSTGDCGSWLHCCPKHEFTLEKPPCIKWKCVCPKPICEPCELEGYGYFPTCWRPFAYPPNYGYCPVPPPGVLASQAPPLAGVPALAAPGATPDESLPSPKKAANPNPDR